MAEALSGSAWAQTQVQTGSHAFSLTSAPQRCFSSDLAWVLFS